MIHSSDIVDDAWDKMHGSASFDGLPQQVGELVRRIHGCRRRLHSHSPTEHLTFVYVPMWGRDEDGMR